MPLNRPAGWFWDAAAGFTGMIAHAGGPPFQIHLLPQHLPRDLRPGRMAIELRRMVGAVALTVADDGGGHALAGPPRRGGSLGRILVEQLARRLGGSVAANGTGGTRVAVRIPVTA
jgi:signal transduction histidine kinase